MIIDRKFKFVAVNPVNGNVYTEENGIVFAAKDEALVPALYAYEQECMKLGCDDYHIRSIGLLIERVQRYQDAFESRRPDTDLPGEIDRCIYGKGLTPTVD